jgi:hypothetical protein
MNNYWILFLIALFCIQNVRAAAAKVEYGPEATAALGQLACGVFWCDLNRNIYRPPAEIPRHYNIEDHGALYSEAVRTRFFNQIKRLVVQERADPDVSFITRINEDGTRKTSHLLPKLLHYDYWYPNSEALEIARVLLEHNADPNQEGRGDGESLLGIASARGIRLLAEFKIRIPKDADQRSSLLINALHPKTFERAKALYSIGFNVHEVIKTGNGPTTPLRTVLWCGSRRVKDNKLDMLCFLINQGANLYSREIATSPISFSAYFEIGFPKTNFPGEYKKLVDCYHKRINLTHRELTIFLNNKKKDVSAIVLDYLSGEGCLREVQKRDREKVVRLARLIKAKKIELDRQHQEESNNRLYDRLLSESLDKFCKRSAVNLLNSRSNTIRSQLGKLADSKRMEGDVKKEQIQKIWNPCLIPVSVHEIVQNKKWWWQRGYACRVSN